VVAGLTRRFGTLDVAEGRPRLIFTCCHPALAMETRVALTLRMVAGLTESQIARAFLVQEAANWGNAPARIAIGTGSFVLLKIVSSLTISLETLPGIATH
jgi:predicted RNA polymerase sigma factor